MVDETGNARGYIQIVSGDMFDPLSPNPDTITIETIAHAGSMQCRYSGHTNKFYSVNEHAAHVSAMLEMWGASPLVQMQGLLHDCDEALGLPDIARPVKSKFPEYIRYGEALQEVVFNKFGLGWPLDPLVKVADNSILFLYERPKLMGKINDEFWKYEGELREANIFIPCWGPEKAKYMFMQRYNYIAKRLGK